MSDFKNIPFRKIISQDKFSSLEKNRTKAEAIIGKIGSNKLIFHKPR